MAWARVVLFCRMMDESPQFPFYGGGVAGGERVVGDVACNYTAGGYDAAVAYGDAGAQDDAASEPAVVADCHVVAGFDGLAPLHVVYGVVDGVYLAVRPYFAMVAYGDAAAVEYGGSVVDECVAADGYHVAVVAVEGGRDVGGGGYAGDECL